MSAIGSILSNDGALKALNSIRTSSNTTSKLEAQLSSGKKINSAADNPAGYITAQGFTSQLNGLNQALSNSNQGVSLLQTAQGAVNQQTSILQKLNSIAVQAANGTQTPSEAQSLQNVVGQLNSQVNTIANQSQFNNINLLDGTFSGVSLQVGANNGQTISLSIAGTKADTIGLHASKVSGSSVYNGSSQGAFSSGTSIGAFSTGSIAINGSNGTASVNVSKATESAASIAQSVNAQTSSTNVQAQARTQVTLDTGTGNNFNFTLGNGTTGTGATNTVNISAVGKDALVNAVNNHTATTGITAKQDADGNLVLSQSQGKNISITDATQGTFSQVDGSGSITSSSSGASGLFQGQVQFQSDQGFNLGSNVSNIGLSTNSQLNALADINVSTTSGAQKAINVVKYALQGLSSEGGKLGAIQQRVQADINNLHTTTQNLNSARSVVQDANIPQVSQQLTQQQVLAQAGISALGSSSQLQQQYQRLLP